MKHNLNAQIKFALASLILVTLACGGAPTPSLNDVSTIVAGTMQAIAPLTSATSQPTTAPLPTNTLAPTPIPPSSNLPAATRINFATGATHAGVEGSIGNSNYVYYYVVRASKDQPMLLSVLSPNDNVKMSVFGANGTILLPATQKQSGWQGILPATQDYYIGLTGPDAIDFMLDVLIPARIKFASGQNKIIITAQTVDLNGIMYVAYALAGQKMDVTINTDPSVAALTIYGFTDGQPYARAQNGVVDFSMVLPSTQDYIIHVVPHTAGTINYTLTVKIQ